MSNLNIYEIFSEHPSYREIEVQPVDSEVVIKVKLRGLSLTDILLNKNVFQNLLKDLQNLDINGDVIMSNFSKNISEEAYLTIHNCIVDDEQKALFTPEFIEEFWDTSVINECILDIVDLTLPSKKKLMKTRETTKRIQQKIELLNKRTET